MATEQVPVFQVGNQARKTEKNGRKNHGKSFSDSPRG
jgi:hypothetical protein